MISLKVEQYFKKFLLFIFVHYFIKVLNNLINDSSENI